MNKTNPLLIVNPLRKPTQTTKQSIKDEQPQLPQDISSFISYQNQPQYHLSKLKTRESKHLCDFSVQNCEQIPSEEFVPKGQILPNTRNQSLEVKSFDRTQNQLLKKRRKTVNRSTSKQYQVSIESKEQFSMLLSNRFTNLATIQSFYLTDRTHQLQSQRKHKSLRIKNLPLLDISTSQPSSKEANSLLGKNSISFKTKQDLEWQKRPAKTVHIINYLNLQKKQATLPWNRFQLKRLERHLIQPCQIRPATMTKRTPASNPNKSLKINFAQKISEERRKFNIRNRKIRLKKEMMEKLQPWEFDRMEEDDQIGQ